METREEIMHKITHTAGFTEQSRNQLFTEVVVELLLDIRELLTKTPSSR
jgi:hypothetical protein